MLSDIATSATVSLIYPSDYSDISLRNMTVATGLTDSNGNFIINPNTSFLPKTNEIFVLDAGKRTGSAGNDVITLRTYIKWNGSNWESITSPGIYINSKTTALTIMSGLNHDLLPALSTIGKMPVINSLATINDVNNHASEARINYVNNLVNSLLQQNKDPVSFIMYKNSDYTIRYFNTTQYVLQTVAGGNFGDGGTATNASLNYPLGISVDSTGNIFISDSNNNRIRKFDANTGIITTIAGNGVPRYNGDGGLATNASLNHPSGVFVDNNGNIFVSDTYNYRIRKVDAVTKIITTVAGNGVPGYSGDDGLATNASFSNSSRVFVDSSGNIFIVDAGNNRIRKIDISTGIITTITGDGYKDSHGAGRYGGDGGLATTASLNNPSGLFVDSSGNVLIADTGNNRIRKVDANTGIINTIVGNGTNGYGGDGNLATNASLGGPSGVFVDSSGNVFIGSNNRVRKIDVNTGIITTVAGNGTYGNSGDGGQATSASLALSSGIFVDSSGNIFIGDASHNSIRKVDTNTKIITTVAGNGTIGYIGDGNLSINATLGFSSGNFEDSIGNIFLAYRVNTGIFVDNSGNIFITDNANNRIRKIDAVTKIITTVAGKSTGGYSTDGSLATNTSLYFPQGVFVDSIGNIFIADSGSNRIRKVDAVTKIITTVAGDGYLNANGVGRYSGDEGLATNASLNYPSGIYVDNNGNIFIADSGNNRIRKVDAVTKIIKTVAGDGYRDANGYGRYAGDGGLATTASLNNPSGISVDNNGNIFIADSFNKRIRKVDANTGIMTTIAGNDSVGYSKDGDLASNSSLGYPNQVSLDNNGNILISDYATIRKVDSLSGTMTTITGQGNLGLKDGILSVNASINSPSGIFLDKNGNIYVSSGYRVFKLTPYDI